jgi:5-methylcytosine-specific restriction endonuclease McrA
MPIANREDRLAYGREYSRRYRQEKSDVHRSTQRTAWGRYRQAAIDTLGGSCVHCGEVDPIVLEIDHIDGRGGAHRKVKSKVGILRSVAADPEGYQLLCANCHRRKTYANGDHLTR